MRQIIFLFSFFMLTTALGQTKLSDYLPPNQNYDQTIPTPASILGHEVGKWHVSHDKLVEYMRALAKASDRISLENRGKTYEDRPLLLLTISAPQHLQNIEEIQKKHLALTEPEGADLDTSTLPVVVYQGFSIHGNEPSGANAGLLLAYHLAASQSAEVEKLLENTVVLFDPSFNPDGLQRFSQWANTHQSKNISTDPNDREYTEVWPRGRTNHYWFDMNRDWLPAQLNESKARIGSFVKWLPNLLTDHHEMGSNATFFFQPGIPSRVNPLTPQKNQILTKQIGQYHAKALDKIGSLYYTEESFDDFYYGKGSTYPDVNGGVGILFEQASSRGHAQETDNGILTFPFTIKNQLTAGLSTLEAAVALRVDLLNYQREFYNNARNEAKKMKTKAYLVGNEKDAESVKRLVEVFLMHGIEVHKANKNARIKGKYFPEENSYVVPLTQKKQRLVRAMFSEQTKFQDSLFYDVSAWTFSHAFDVNMQPLNSLDLRGDRITTTRDGQEKKVEKSNYAYLFETHNYNSPRVIYALQDKGIRVKVSQQPFQIDGKKYDYGSIMIPVANQVMGATALHELLQKLAQENELQINAVATGLTQGIDLGSRNFSTVPQPKIALLVGDGVRSYDAGEIWYLMDTQYDIPITKLDVKQVGRVDLSTYTHIVLPSYRGSLLNQAAEKIQHWVKNGGHFIAYRDAISWLNTTKIVPQELKKTELTAENIPFVDRDKFIGAQAIGGAIFNTQIDRSHPINFGLEDNELALFRNSRIYLQPDENSFDNPIQYTNDPLLSGYISEEQLELLKGTVPFKRVKKGSGSYLLMTDNTNFRAFWLGTQQLLANMLFYADIM